MALPGAEHRTARAFTIRIVGSAADLDDTKRLIADYASALGVDLSFQGLASELASLPGDYLAPQGVLLIARRSDGVPLGCVAARRSAADCCEMKRLYVAPGARGLGLGRALVDAVVDAAAGLGYRAMRLDTLPTMSAAIALYRDAGFRPIAPYHDTPISGTLFFSRRLLP